MSDTALKNARMSDELERTLIHDAIIAESLSGHASGSRWLRLKVRLAAFGAPSARCCTTWTPAVASTPWSPPTTEPDSGYEKNASIAGVFLCLAIPGDQTSMSATR